MRESTGASSVRGRPLDRPAPRSGALDGRPGRARGGAARGAPLRAWSGRALGLTALLAAAGCGGGGGGGGGDGSSSGFLGGSGVPGMAATRACSGSCDVGANLNEQQVMTIVDQGARELAARGVPGVIAVVDRVGNPLAVWASSGDPLLLQVTSQRPENAQVAINSFANGLENAQLPASFGALSKAITGAYLSSQGNAFSTRTANYIVHSNFPPRSDGEASGPLFGVQFSQLSCGDWVRRDDAAAAGANDPLDGFVDGRAGPKRSPLGLSADAGGFPLYMNGVLVGGVGVSARETTGTDAMGRSVPLSIYGVDGNPNGGGGTSGGLPANLEEEVALAALRSFEASDDRVANRISIMGRALRYSNTGRGTPRSPAATALVNALPAGGALVAVPGFYDGMQVRPGTRFGNAESGIAPASGSSGGTSGFTQDRSGRPIQAQLAVNPDGTPFLGRLAGPVSNPRASLVPAAPVGLSPAEVTRLLDRALSVAQEARSNIRRPGGSGVQVNVHVCDRDGNSLGYARSPDAPLFGSDVALQKCRTAALLSRGAPTAPPGPENAASAADQLLAEDTAFQNQGRSRVAAALGMPNGVRNQTMGQYLQRLRAFIPDADALADGIAFSDRATGLLARPCFPDGVNCTSDGRGGVAASGGAGPLSTAMARMFSPLSVGFQLEYAKDALLDGTLGRSLGVPEPARCGSLAAGGFQIFPGSVPLFKREVDAQGNPTGRSFQVGALGISGDGVDQDDLVAFLGVDRAANGPGALVMNAPRQQRANTISPNRGGGTFLRYVNCPASPFNPPFEREQGVCEGR